MKNSIFFFALLFLAISSYQLHAESDTLWTTQIGSTVPTVKFSPDGDYVYAAAEGRGPLKLDAKNGDIIMEYEGIKYSTKYEFYPALDISPDGKMIVGGDLHKLYLYNYDDSNIIDSLETNTMSFVFNKFNDVIFTKDNKYVIGCVNYGNSTTNPPSRLFIWDLATKKLIYYLNGERILRLAIDKNNKTLAYIEKNQGDDTDINLLEIGTWKNVGVLKGHTSRITDLSFSPDGTLLASCDDYSNVKIWNIEKKEMLIGYKRNVRNTFSLVLINNNLITFGGGDFEKFNITTTNLENTNTLTTYNLTYPLDFEYNKNISAVITDFTGVICLKADRLTSVSSDFTKDLLYPNPATNLLTVPKTFFGNSFVAMSITDLTGKVVYTFDNNQQTDDLIIDISAYNTGSYYLNFNYKSRSQSSRFIKE